MPGSGFAQTFIGMDVVVVMFLISKARRLARKWGGQCIIFIDEIDAVGMRRQALQGGGIGGRASPQPVDGPGVLPRPLLLRPDGRADPDAATWSWRTARVARAPVRGARARVRLRSTRRPSRAWDSASRASCSPAGWAGMGGGMALNQLLVQMDGVDDPPFMRKFFTNRVNTFLDATYLVPQQVGQAPLRLRPPKPRGRSRSTSSARPTSRSTCSTRRSSGPGAWAATSGSARRPRTTARTSSTSTWRKVDHDPTSTRDRRRDELARITNGYSPGDDRAGLLDGADARALRGPRRSSSGPTSSRR